MKSRFFLLLLLISRLSLYAQSGVDKPMYEIVTYRDSVYLGTFTIELFPSVAPLHTNNFDSLAAQHFFDSTAFHRVVPGFVIQGGDPNSISGPVSTWGQGQPWQPTVPAEFTPARHYRGIIGAARDTNINSANSQFYICVANAFFLDNNYTVFGKVVSGMDIVDTIVAEPADVNEVPLRKISMFVTEVGVDDSIPAAPTLIGPANNAVNINITNVFSWTPVPSAVLYNVQIASDSLFTTIVDSKNAGLSQMGTFHFPGSADYYWRVRTNNGGHFSPWSNYWKFTAVTDSADLISPADSATNLILNPVFSWHSVLNADTYTLQVSKSPNFAPNVTNYTGLTDTVFQVNPLQANTVYYWRVRSYKAGIAGFNSVTRTFTTGTLMSVNAPDSPEGFTVFPNPVIDQISLQFKQTPAPGLRIEITDINGKVVYSGDAGELRDLRLSVNVSNLPSGAYTISAISGTSVVPVPFIRH